MTNRKVVSKPRAYWIMLRSLLATLGLSLYILIVVNLRIYKRAKADKHFQRWARKVLGFVRARYRVVNDADFQFESDKPYIIMSNHASHYDIPLIVTSFTGRSVRMMTKKELMRVPIWGKAMQLSEFVSIDREDRHQAMKDLKDALAKMHSGIVLWVAPEGTRSKTGKIQPFKKGGFRLALDMGAVIIPVGIRGSQNILPPKTLSNFSLHQEAEVHIGPPIDSTKYGKSSSKALMKDVEERIRALAGQGEQA
jgi:1-acyl-sn-glycerol-3-phosphate acyltransferase